MAGIWLTGDIVLLYTFISFIGRYMITEYSNPENHKRKPKAAQVEPVWLYKNPQNKHPNKPAKAALPRCFELSWTPKRLLNP